MFDNRPFILVEDEPGDFKISRPDLINRRGIYKDVLDPEVEWTEYQLRPNFCIAMVLAPELFNVKHAMHALKVVKETLLGPLGIVLISL